MIRAAVHRSLVLTAAFAAALTPVTCLGQNSDQLPANPPADSSAKPVAKPPPKLPAKATKPLPPELLSQLRQKKMPVNSPIQVAHTDRNLAKIFPSDDPPPHYLGHRERLRTRFCDAGADAIADYELLELLLFRAIPRRDVKPLAKDLIKIFGSFAEVISAPRKRLHEEGGLSEAAITELKIVQAAAGRITRGEARKRPVLSSWSAVIEHCRTTMAFESKEQFRIIFLDKRNQIIADEVQQTGTVDHTPVYPREVVKRALELSATAVILVHNHPSGDPTPSRADIQMTQQIVDIAKPLGIAVHDHIIVGKDGHASLKALKLI